MEEETKEVATSEGPPALPSPVLTLSLDDLKAALASVVQPLQAKIEALEAAREEDKYASGVPMELRRADPRVKWQDSRVARRATVATRPAVENPEDYEHIVDSGVLSQKEG